MLKRIKPAEVEIGMFIHKLEGGWLSHPFWRARFLLTDEKRLAKLRGSAIDAVIIDTERGRDLAGAAGDQPARDPAARAASPHGLPPHTPASRRRVVTPVASAKVSPDNATSFAPRSRAREFGQARRVTERAEQTMTRVLLQIRLGKAIQPNTVVPVIEDVLASIQRNPHALHGLMRCRRNSGYVYRHAVAVSALMITLARRLRLSAAQVREAGLAGLLLDVGIGLLPVDLEALGGDYRRIEPELLASHASLGERHLAASNLPQTVIRAAREHHERHDGAGYPDGLAGDTIGLYGRMGAICAAYDELTNDAHGAPGLDPATAMQTLREDVGAHDPALLDSFIEAMGVYPVGAVVLLRSGRLALVIEQNTWDHSRPVVRPFWSLETRGAIKAAELALAECFGVDAIEGTADPAEFGVPDFAELRDSLLAPQPAKRGKRKAAAGDEGAPSLA